MFIAPFGMLLAKWATLVSFADTGQVALIVLLAFGSAATFMFWAKWLGKLSGIAARPENVEAKVHSSEWVAIMVMAVLVILCCIGLPIISWAVVEPYIYSVFGTVGQDISSSNLWTTSIYLAGVSRDNAERTFSNSLSGESTASARNWYLEGIFGEKRLSPFGTACCTVIIVIAFAAAAVGVPGLF